MAKFLNTVPDLVHEVLINLQRPEEK